MVDSLLRLSYAAVDAAAATTAASAVLGPSEVTMRGSALSWRQVSVVDDGISISRVDAAGEAVRLAVAGSTELVVVRVRSGSAVVQHGEHRADLQRDGLALIPIGARAQVRLDRAELEITSFPPAPLARLLGVPKHAVQLHAPRIEPRSPELAAYFVQVSRLLTTGVFGVPEVYDRDLIRTHAIDMLVAVAVEAFELTNRSEDDTARDVVVLRRALAELRSHLAEPISVPEVAQAAGVSVRGLQLIFQRQLGTSPLLHLRALRLEAARQALADEAARGTTIAEIARRFGYSNSGRFSTHYRDTYGESPTAGLARARTRPERPSSSSEAEIVRPDDRLADVTASR